MEIPTQEDNLEGRLNTAVDLLSSVTDQPVSLFYVDPLEFNGSLDDELDFTCGLYLGEEYRIKFWHTLKKEEEFFSGSWSVDRAGHEIRNRTGEVLSSKFYSSSESYRKRDIEEDPKLVDRSRISFLLKELSGIDVDNPVFMDYENHTLESLNGDNRYFQSIYLSIMCSLKENGIQLPPIISKKPNIREAMYRGDIETLDSILLEELESVLSEYGPNMLKHTQLEASEIRSFALKRRQYHDKSVPLIEKMADWNVLSVPGNNSQRKYNVLVVEDFGGSLEDRFGTIGQLSEKVLEELKAIGRYGGTNIFPTFNICDCLEICGTGQIDAILMDGGHFLLGEAEEIMMMDGGGIGLSYGLSGDYEATEIPNLDGYGEKNYCKWSHPPTKPYYS